MEECSSSFAEADALGRRNGFGRRIATLEAGDTLGEPLDAKCRALVGATLVAREATELLALTITQYVHIFEGAQISSTHMRPSLLRTRLVQLKRHEPRRSAPVRLEFVEGLLRCVPAFRDAPRLQALLPHLDCVLHHPGDVVSAPGKASGSIFLVVFGVVEVFAGDATVGELTVGDQFGHMPLIWNESTNPVGYRARSLVVCVAVDERAYRGRWHKIYDADEVALATFLRKMPLFRSLALFDVLCIRHKLVRLELSRGSLKRRSDLGDDVYFIFSGECRLLVLPKPRESSLGLTQSTVDIVRSADQIATLGRYNAFGDPAHPNLALLAVTGTTVLRCSLAYLRQHYPAIIADLEASTALMLDWTYANVVRSQSVQHDEVGDRIEDGRRLFRALAASASTFRSKPASLRRLRVADDLPGTSEPHPPHNVLAKRPPNAASDLREKSSFALPRISSKKY